MVQTRLKCLIRFCSLRMCMIHWFCNTKLSGPFNHIGLVYLAYDMVEIERIRSNLGFSVYFRIFSESNFSIRFRFRYFRISIINSEFGTSWKFRIFGIFENCILIVNFGKKIEYFRNYVGIFGTSELKYHKQPMFY